MTSLDANTGSDDHVVTFASDKHCRLDDLDQRNTRGVDEEGKFRVQVVPPSVDFLSVATVYFILACCPYLRLLGVE